MHSGHCCDNSLDDHQVHKLPVDELLQGKRPERARPFPVEPERVSSHKQLDRQEDEPQQPDPQRVKEDQAVQGKNIDDGREEGKQYLEDKQVAESAAAELSGRPFLQHSPRCFHIAWRVP